MRSRGHEGGRIGLLVLALLVPPDVTLSRLPPATLGFASALFASRVGPIALPSLSGRLVIALGALLRSRPFPLRVTSWLLRHASLGGSALRLAAWVLRRQRGGRGAGSIIALLELALPFQLTRIAVSGVTPLIFG